MKVTLSKLSELCNPTGLGEGQQLIGTKNSMTAGEDKGV